MYCKYDNKTKRCTQVGTGSNAKFYKKLGMKDVEVELGYDGNYYLKGHAPEKPVGYSEPTKDPDGSIRISGHLVTIG